MKEVNILLTFSILFLTTLILPLTFTQSNENNGQFDPEDISTWSSDTDTVRGMNKENKNSIWEHSLANEKYRSINSIANNIREVRHAGESVPGKPASPSESPLHKLTLTGFESTSLKWTSGLIMGDGNIEVDLENLNFGVTEIIYIPGENKKSKLIYKFSDGSEIVIRNGKINQNLIYTGKNYPPSIAPSKKTNLELIPGENGKIDILDDTRISISGDAKLEITTNEKEKISFSNLNPSLNKNSYIKNIGEYEKGEWLEVESSDVIKIETRKATIEIPADKKTNFVFNDGDFSHLENYVQIYRDDVSGIESGNRINIKGNFEENNKLHVRLQSDAILITGDGNNLILDNGRSFVLFKGDKTYIDRYSDEISYGVKIRNLQNPNQELTLQPTSLSVELAKTNSEMTNVYVKPGQFDSKDIGIKTSELDYDYFIENSANRVCIGQFCTVGVLKPGSLSETQFVERPLDYNQLGQILVGRTNVYATENQVNDFINLARANRWTDTEILEQASTYFTQSEKVYTIDKELSQNQFDSILTNVFSPLNLPNPKQTKINNFKLEVYENLPNSQVPIGSELIVASYYTGSDKSSHGTLFFSAPSGPRVIQKIPGRYFEDAKRIEFKQKKYLTKELIKTIRKYY